MSLNGGCQPLWREDGKELFYLAHDGTLMVVEFRGGQLTPGAPQPLFQTVLSVNPERDQYTVTRDGQRFILLTREQEDGRSSLNIIQHWFEELKDREPVP